MLEIGIKYAIKHAQNVVISAEDFSPRQIGHFIEELTEVQSMTIRRAHLIPDEDIERLCNRASPGKVTFDFSEPSYFVDPLQD